jgi:hypothetical protein
MVIVDEKNFMPYGAPPPYAASSSNGLLPFPHGRNALTLAAWPPHLLLKVVYMTFPHKDGFVEEVFERQRKTLYWLSVRLRLVNRTFYIACMHVLRSTYLPAYNSLIRPPYTSDPFPHSIAVPSQISNSSPSSSTSHIQTDLNSIQSLQRETSVLDHFIALKVHEDVWADESELHLERDESFKDLFDLMQPRSRIEDLVRHYGMRDGLISIGVSSSGRSTPTSSGVRSSSFSVTRGKRPTPLPFSALSVTFSPRNVELLLLSQGRKRTIVRVARSREEKLEYAAKRLVKELGVYLWSGQ